MVGSRTRVSSCPSTAPAGNIGKSVDGVVGRSLGTGMGWDGMGRAQGDEGYLSAAVRAEWRLVAAGEGTENRRRDGGEM